ncbi:MAG TPA: hypothetical protein VJG67_01005 [Candidatus Paceibacterota bacterium]
MNSHSKLKYLFIVLVVLVLIGVVYVLQMTKKPEAPYEVSTPSVYPLGTTVSLYRNVPPGFPEEVLLEDERLSYSGSIDFEQGKSRSMSVSYISNKSMKDVFDLYTSSLPKLGWNVNVEVGSEKVVVIRAVKGIQSVLISISPLDNNLMVTFQYEK